MHDRFRRLHELGNVLARAAHRRAPRILRATRQHLYLCATALLAVAGYAMLVVAPAAALYALAYLPGIYASHGWLGVAANASCVVGAGALSIYLFRTPLNAPHGHALSELQAQVLQHKLEQSEYGAVMKRIGNIRITDQLEITWMKIPSRALALTWTSTLYIGLPMLMALSREQFALAVTRRLWRPRSPRQYVMRWLSAQRSMWQAYDHTFAARHDRTARCIRPLITFYQRVYCRVSAPLARMYELRLDRTLSEHVASDDLVTLMSTEICAARFLNERFWPAIDAQVKRQAEPPAPYGKLETAMYDPYPRDDAKQWLQQAATSEHAGAFAPNLTRRLNNLGHLQAWPPSPPQCSAGRDLLGESFAKLVATFDQQWADDNRVRWRALHKMHAPALMKLAALRAKAAQRTLHGREARKYASLVKQYMPPDEVAATLTALLAVNDTDARLQFGVGRILLANDEPEGILALKRAVSLDRRYQAPAHRLIGNFAVTAIRTHGAAGPFERTRPQVFTAVA